MPDPEAIAGGLGPPSRDRSVTPAVERRYGPLVVEWSGDKSPSAVSDRTLAGGQRAPRVRPADTTDAGPT